MYSTVCKTKKKMQENQVSSLQQMNCQTVAVSELEDGLRESMSWPKDDHCYEAVEAKSWPKMLNSDPAYATVDFQQKKERKCRGILKPKKSLKNSSGYFPGQENVLTCENFYETIGDVKQVTNSTSAINVFTLDEGMEM